MKVRVLKLIFLFNSLFIFLVSQINWLKMNLVEGLCMACMIDESLILPHLKASFYLRFVQLERQACKVVPALYCYNLIHPIIPYCHILPMSIEHWVLSINTHWKFNLIFICLLWIIIQRSRCHIWSLGCESLLYRVN